MTIRDALGVPIDDADQREAFEKWADETLDPNANDLAKVFVSEAFEAGWQAALSSVQPDIEWHRAQSFELGYEAAENELTRATPTHTREELVEVVAIKVQDVLQFSYPSLLESKLWDTSINCARAALTSIGAIRGEGVQDLIDAAEAALMGGCFKHPSIADNLRKALDGVK